MSFTDIKSFHHHNSVKKELLLSLFTEEATGVPKG